MWVEFQKGKKSMEQQKSRAAVARAKTYTQQDFAAFTDEQLDAYEQEGRAWQDSSVNFMVSGLHTLVRWNIQSS